MMYYHPDPMTVVVFVLFCTCVLTLYFTMISVQCIGIPMNARRDPEFLDMKLRNYAIDEIEFVQDCPTTNKDMEQLR